MERIQGEAGGGIHRLQYVSHIRTADALEHNLTRLRRDAIALAMPANTLSQDHKSPQEPTHQPPRRTALIPDSQPNRGERLAKNTDQSTNLLVDEIIAGSLAEERNLPEGEIDAALHG